MSADVEALLIAALAPAVGVPVSTVVPDPYPPAFVRLVAAGGPPVADLVVDRATVAWEAWADDSVAAVRLALQLRDAIDHLPGHQAGGAWVLDASCDRPRWFPDASGKARYVGTAEIVIHDNN